jgi:hypothetical protein
VCEQENDGKTRPFLIVIAVKAADLLFPVRAIHFHQRKVLLLQNYLLPAFPFS